MELFWHHALQDADVIIHNAKVYTVNESFDIQSAVAIKDGRFIAVGGEEIVSKYNAAATLDFKGLPVYPALLMPIVIFISWDWHKNKSICGDQKV